MYHVKDGLYFKKEPDGSVTVVVIENKTWISHTNFDMDTFASVISAMCGRGENLETFRDALNILIVK